jgi:hypothetical protein
MPHYRSSTSFLAIIRYWNEKKLHQFFHAIPPDWSTSRFRHCVGFIRTLYPHERSAISYSGDQTVPWYGVFTHESGVLMAVSDSLMHLQRSIREQRYAVVFAH